MSHRRELDKDRRPVTKGRTLRNVRRTLPSVPQNSTETPAYPVRRGAGSIKPVRKARE
ncbi:MAG: hypothetical protein V7609_1478 [Verrucomicrobiota bacterium]